MSNKLINEKISTRKSIIRKLRILPGDRKNPINLKKETEVFATLWVRLANDKKILFYVKQKNNFQRNSSFQKIVPFPSNKL